MNREPGAEVRRHGDGVRPASKLKEAIMAATPSQGTSAPSKQHGQPKRTLTPANILRTTANCAIAFPIIIRSVFWPKTSKALREKVCLGVTAINDCRFCAWGHSHWAISQGIPPEEVNRILSSQNESLKADDPAEAAAILFGQHYAEQLGKIDPESVKNLGNYFSPAQVREVLGYVYFITFTNLSGNTVDALVERICGKGGPITVFQGVVGAILAPILFILLALVKAGKFIGTDKRRAKRHGAVQDVPPDSGSAHAG
jgi:AhpD family alkylhydroperoxidase